MTNIFRMAEECNGHSVFLLSMTGCFKKDSESAGHLGFLFLITGIFRMTKECNGHLVFLLLMTGCFKKDKECAGRLVFLFLLTGYQSCKHCVKFYHLSHLLLADHTKNTKIS